MNIQIVNVVGPTAIPGKKYSTLEVAYKDENGKIAGKKLLSFNHPLVFNTLKAAQSGENYEVTSVQEKGYWQWTEAKKVEGGQVAKEDSPKASTQQYAAQANDRYETKEERATRQVMIVRQSSISNAIQTLAVGGKSALNPDNVITAAKIYEDYVLGRGVQGIVDMSDDLPE